MTEKYLNVQNHDSKASIISLPQKYLVEDHIKLLRRNYDIQGTHLRHLKMQTE